MSIPLFLYALKTATVKLSPLTGTGPVRDFSDHITSLQLVPSSPTKVPVITGRKFAGQASWDAQIGLMQDLADTGFLRFLYENEGEAFKAVFTFADGSDPIELELVAVPAAIGGNAGDDLQQSSVTCPVNGRPSWLTSEPPENP